MVSMVKISPNSYKICFIPYLTTISIKKKPLKKKNLRRSKIVGERSRVGLTAVKD